MHTLVKSVFMVATAAVVTQAAAQVTFYEHDGFEGRSFTTERQVGNFERFGFNDRASSVVVLRDRWEVCSDVQFSGRCVVLRAGRYPSLTAMGSSMVALIIKLWKGAKEHQRRMVVVNSNRLVAEVLQISGLADVWTIVPTREEAIRELGDVSSPLRESSAVPLISAFGWLALSGAIIGLLKPPVEGLVSTPGPLVMLCCCAGIAMLAGTVTLRRGQGVWRAAGLLQSVAALVAALAGLWSAK